MEKEEYRSVIRFLFLQGKPLSEIKNRLDAVYGASSPSMATVQNWFNEFARGRTSVFDEPRRRPGAAGAPKTPKTAVTDETIGKVHDLVLADRQLKAREIAETTGISKERVGHILYEILGMRKVLTQWVPRLLTIEYKHNRETVSETCLALYRRNPNEFLRRFVTVDETWIHWYTPETEEPAGEEGAAPTKKAKAKTADARSAGKVGATVFWDSQGIIHIDYLEKGKTITGVYYAELLERFNVELKKKRPRLAMAKKKVLFHQDNAPAHTTAAVSMAKLFELRYELLPHPTFSPDLAPGDFFLFPNLKKSLAGKRYRSNEEVIAATEDYFAALDKSYFSEGLKRLEYRWVRCIELKGDYVEE